VFYRSVMVVDFVLGSKCGPKTRLAARSTCLGLVGAEVTSLKFPCPSGTSRENNKPEINNMAKFMCTHTIGPGKFSADQLRQFAQAAQQDPTVKGYRSFANLAEGKAVCIMEAPGKDAVAAWFTKMGMPFDTITKVELEGDRGSIQSA